MTQTTYKTRQITQSACVVKPDWIKKNAPHCEDIFSPKYFAFRFFANYSTCCQLDKKRRVGRTIEMIYK